MECTECNGFGEKLMKHPAYGTPSCPEAEVMEICVECDGTGEVLTECDNCGAMKADIITGVSSSGETSQCGECRGFRG